MLETVYVRLRLVLLTFGALALVVIVQLLRVDFGSTNMTTWNDRMNGYSTVPSDHLDLAMQIESDRMRTAKILDSERQPEMSVVRNEYEIGENNPAVALEKAVVGAAIVAHPYHWDTIGYRSDIEGVSTEQLREHYRHFFWPDNSCAIIVGDFVLFSAPRNARPMPVRAVETMTASLMDRTPVAFVKAGPHSGGVQRIGVSVRDPTAVRDTPRRRHRQTDTAGLRFVIRFHRSRPSSRMMTRAGLASLPAILSGRATIS